MEFFKSLEVAIRQILLKGLRFFISRSNPLPPTIDFNASKFLFIRQDRIGDVLISTPLIYTLKECYPDAVIDFLLSINNYFVLDNEPLVRKRYTYRKNLSSAWSIIKKIRQERYDFIIDLMDNPSTTSTFFCALTNGRWNVGFEKLNDYVYDLKVPLLSRKDIHIVDRLSMLLVIFGIQPDKHQLKIRYCLSEKSNQLAQEFLRKNRLSDRFIIGLNISPARGVRFWGIANFQKLIGSLLHDYPDVALLVLYQPTDIFQAKKIAEPFNEVLVSPETKSFDEFAAYIKSINLLVTPDTSTVHLAAAFTIPSVVLYVQSNKNLRIWEPYGSESEAIVTDVDDLTTIQPTTVHNAVKRLRQRIG